MGTRIRLPQITRNIIPIFLSYSNDVLIGGFTRLHRLSRSISATDSLYFPDYATWCVKAVPKTPNWKNIFFIFSTWLWVAVVIAFIAVTLSVYAYVRATGGKKDAFSAIMCAIKISIGFMPGLSPRTFLGKSIFLLFLMYGLIVSTLFQSATVSSMTSQYHKGVISSLAEAVKNDFEFAGSSVSRTIFLDRKNEVSSTEFPYVVPSLNFHLFFLICFTKDEKSFQSLSTVGFVCG